MPMIEVGGGTAAILYQQIKFFEFYDLFYSSSKRKKIPILPKGEFLFRAQFLKFKSIFSDTENHWL